MSLVNIEAIGVSLVIPREVFIYCNISCSGISKIVSLQKADLYIDIICITQNKIVKNRKRNNI